MPTIAPVPTALEDIWVERTQRQDISSGLTGTCWDPGRGQKGRWGFTPAHSPESLLNTLTALVSSSHQEGFSQARDGTLQSLQLGDGGKGARMYLKSQATGLAALNSGLKARHLRYSDPPQPYWDP